MFRSLDFAAFGLGVAVVGGVIWYARKAGVTSDTFNPASPNNAASVGVNRIVAVLTGDANQTLGGLAYDLVNPRAGLAANEVRNADGSISVVMPKPIDTSEDYSLFGETYGGFTSTPGGAAVYVPRKM